MATIEWLGGSTDVAQENRFTPGGTIESNDKFIITLTNEAGATLAITTAAGGTTVAAVTAALLTAWNTAAALEANTGFTDGITASDQTTYFKLLGTVGVPFYAAATTTESDDSAADAQTFTKTATTPCAGKNDFNTATNWSTGAVPGNSDTVYFTNRASDAVLYGLVQTSGSPTLTLLRFYQGHPQVGTLAAALNMKVTTWEHGVTPEDGIAKTSNSIVNLKFGNTATVGRVYSTATQGTSGRAPVQVDVDNASSAFTVQGNSIVGFATAVTAETSTVGTLTVKDRARVTGGVGLTLTTLNPEGGTTVLNAGLTTVAYGKGAVVLNAGSVTTINVGGDVTWQSSGTATNLNVSGAGLAHCYTGTITNAFVYGEKAKVDADSGVALSCTFTNGIDCLQGAKSSQVNFGDNVTVTPTAP